MKKLLIACVALVLTLGVSAQKIGRGYYVRPRASIVVGAYPSYYYSPFYNPWGYPRYSYGYRPTKLDMQIADIKNDYSDRIWSAKHDDRLSRSERRREVRQLRHDRDKAILDAKRNYHYRR